jgi:hypothetical protein
MASCKDGIITGSGNLYSWNAQKKRAALVWDLFIKAHPDITNGVVDFNQIPEAILGSKKIYERYATYLANEYKISKGPSKGQYYAMSTAINTLSIALQRAAILLQFTHNIKTKEFFLCLIYKSTTKSAKWLHQLKKNMIRFAFQQSLAIGEKMDKSCLPLYINDIKQVMKAYTREGSGEACMRKLAIISLWQFRSDVCTCLF